MIHKIIQNYDKYRVKHFSTLSFNYSSYISYLETADLSVFDKQLVGKSFEERDIYLFKAGSGNRKLFFWSQMHGNEPVSSQGLIDFMSFMSADDEFNELRNSILQENTIYCLPLLNPDGAERFSRRNAQMIDINRDAVKKISSEARTLDRL